MKKVLPKYVYFGTPYVARDTLALLCEQGLVPSLVVTSPDAPRGRGLTLTPSETKEWALAHNLPVLTYEKLDATAQEEIASYGCDLAIVVAYGTLLPKKLIDAFPEGVLNIHYSLLPKYRGASPVEAALLHNDDVTGVTIQKMVLALDAGDIVAQRKLAIEPHETTKELRPRLIKLGAQLLIESLPPYLAGTLEPVPQDPNAVTFCGRIEKSEGLLDLAGSGEENWNKYRAYAESPGTYFFTERKGRQMRVKITEARFEKGAFVATRVIPEGKREMRYEDFLRAG